MKLLIVRLSAMGDILHGLPLAENARRAGARVAWLTQERYASLIEDAPFVEKVFMARNRREASSAGQRPFALRRALRAWKPDVTIDAQGLWKSAVAARLASAPVVGFSSSVRREPASALLCDRPVLPSARLRHVVDRNLALLEAAGLPIVTTAPRAGYLLERASPPASEFLDRQRRPFALYHPGSKRAEKAWGEDNFAALARRLFEERGLEPVISWGPGDEERVARFRAALPESALLPALDYHGLAHVIAASALFVGGDTGPLHLADALGVCALGLYGPTDPDRNGPYRRPEAALRYNSSTPVEAVAARALELLSTR
jgi:lipopolysaccharide heptosyltransferase I